jgi:dTDP-4-amino-4,6-dideoxygalactose transaminase
MINKEAKNSALNVEPRYFTKSARSGFLHVLRYIKSKNSKPILLPAYIGINDYEGSGVFDSVYISRIAYEFYPLDKSLNVQIQTLKEMIESKRFGALLLIHYFGFPTNDFDIVIDLCRKNDVLVIEDCAHVLNGSYEGKKLGEIGDFSFYSIHKSIATFDGGIVKINNSKFDDFPVICPLKEGISSFAMAQMFRTNLKQVDEKRRNNYLVLASKFKASKYYTLLHPDLKPDIVPLNLPVLIHNSKREKIYYELIDRGVHTMALYYRMIPQIDKNIFQTSYEVSESILNFPIHQEMEENDLDLMAEAFNRIIKNLEK